MNHSSKWINRKKITAFVWEKKQKKTLHLIENNLKLKDRLVSIACEWISEFSLRFWAYISSHYHDLINKLYTKKMNVLNKNVHIFVNVWIIEHSMWSELAFELRYISQRALALTSHFTLTLQITNLKKKWNEMRNNLLSISYVAYLLVCPFFFSV